MQHKTFLGVMVDKEIAAKLNKIPAGQRSAVVNEILKKVLKV